MRLGDIKLQPEPCPFCGKMVAVGDFHAHIADGHCTEVADKRTEGGR